MGALFPGASRAGFSLTFPAPKGGESLHVFAQGLDGSVHELTYGESVDSAALAPRNFDAISGETLMPVTPAPAGTIGFVDTLERSKERAVVLPSDARQYDWLEVASRHGLGLGRFSLIPSNSNSAPVQFSVSERGMQTYRVMVANCTGWHGDSDGPAVLRYTGSQEIESIRLLR